MFLTECPRDAMQGWGELIPTAQKIDYINSLMAVGFDVLDCGSFVSPKAIPQMADTAEVIPEIEKTSTKISVIVANISGAERALKHSKIDILGFPFSMSETFQHRNTNKSQEEAFEQIKTINELTKSEGKTLNIYFSMAFGNPYGEIWKKENIVYWVKRLEAVGIENILLSDTIGVATPMMISEVFSEVPQSFPNISFGAHFHNRYEESYAKINAAYSAGCRRFDTAIKGLGGCPMAKDDLVGNLPTEQLINFIQQRNIDHSLHLLNFESAWNIAKNIFRF
ncbi:MAG: hydroxymethylglutaryl-CoA lyase [Bergeyella zoohelcum]|nr:hydroxymethylglutaryl-CoA lyase [Bergeyella zoohelcum]